MRAKAASLAGTVALALSQLVPRPSWAASATQADEPAAPKPRVIGTILPPLTLSTRTDVWWTAPSAPLTVALGAGAASATRSALAVGRFIAQQLNWSKKVWALSYIAAVLPLGTFLFERKYLPHSK